MSEHEEQVATRNATHLLQKANVVGVAGGEDKLLVLVSRKLPLEQLAAHDVVERELNGIQTDVIEVGEIEPLALRAGSSIGLASGGTGTLGGVVNDELGMKYYLTNNHVAAATNKAAMLSDIHSPGQADGLGQRVGKLARYEPIYSDALNYIDAALVRADMQAFNNYNASTTTARTGWHVNKRGRTSGYTEGDVLAREVTVNVNYGDFVARFTGQLLTTPMLEPGDSGSVLLSRGGHPVGLCFAGSDRVSIHTPINLVLRTLSVRFT